MGLHMNNLRRICLLMGCLLLAAHAGAQTALPDAPLPNAAQEKQARALFGQLRCMVCDGQSLADSNAPLAQDMRRMVRSKIESGQSPEEIMDYFARRYGDAIRMRPPLASHTWPLWLGPLLVILIGAFIFRRFFRQRDISHE